MQPALHHQPFLRAFLRAPHLSSFALTLLPLIFFVVPCNHWIYPIFFLPAHSLLPGKAPQFVIVWPMLSATGKLVKAVAVGGDI